MTEFEMATIAYQQASLEIANRATYISMGLGCIALWGILVMRASNKSRAKAMDEQRRRDDQRHEEEMTALKALIGRTNPAPTAPSGAD